MKCPNINFANPYQPQNQPNWPFLGSSYGENRGRQSPGGICMSVRLSVCPSVHPSPPGPLRGWLRPLRGRSRPLRAGPPSSVPAYEWPGPASERLGSASERPGSASEGPLGEGLTGGGTDGQTYIWTHRFPLFYRTLFPMVPSRAAALLT